MDPASGAITAITVVSVSSGYTATATGATVIGGGTGAVLAPAIDPATGAITSITITAPGSGYNSVP